MADYKSFVKDGLYSLGQILSVEKCQNLWNEVYNAREYGKEMFSEEEEYLRYMVSILDGRVSSDEVDIFIWIVKENQELNEQLNMKQSADIPIEHSFSTAHRS